MARSPILDIASGFPGYQGRRSRLRQILERSSQLPPTAAPSQSQGWNLGNFLGQVGRGAEPILSRLQENARLPGGPIVFAGQTALDLLGQFQEKLVSPAAENLYAFSRLREYPGQDIGQVMEEGHQQYRSYQEPTFETPALGPIEAATRNIPVKGLFEAAIDPLNWMIPGGGRAATVAREAEAVAKAGGRAVAKGAEAVAPKARRLATEEAGAFKPWAGEEDVVRNLNRMEEVSAKLDDVERQIAEHQATLSYAKEGMGIVRPPAGTSMAGKLRGFTDEQLAQLARQEGRDPFLTDWWDGLDSVAIRDWRSSRRATGGRAAQMRTSRAALKDLRTQEKQLQTEFDALALEMRKEGVEVQETMAPRTSVQTGLPGVGPEAAQGRMLEEFGRARGTEGQAPGLMDKEALLARERAKPLPGQAAMPEAPRAGLVEEGGRLPEAEIVPTEPGPSMAEPPQIPPGGKGPPAGGVPPRTPIPPPEDVISRLTKLIKQWKPIRRETEALYSKERGKRFGAFAGTRAGEGELAAIQARGQLKGELPKPQFEPIRGEFTQADVDQLFNKIREAPLRPGETAQADDALWALLDPTSARIPQKSQIALLEKVFGSEMVKAILDKRSLGTRFWDEFVAAINLPRSLMASIDLSATLRQGALLTYGHPKVAGGAFKAQLRAMASESGAQAVMDSIKSHRLYPIAEQAGLDILEFNRKLGAQEEAFISKLAARIPGVKQSGRAYTTDLNKLRWDVFKDRVEQWEKLGINPETGLAVGKDLKYYEDYARALNILSGRGDLGRLNRMTALLNTGLFSPRYVASRFQAPFLLLSRNPDVRREAFRDLGSFFATNIGLLTLAGAAGIVSVETDPRSTDFMKFRIGKQRIDPWAGFQPLVRYLAQVQSGERKTTSTKAITPINRAETVGRFVESKLAPTPSMIWDLLQGRTFIGEELEPTKETAAKIAFEHLMPLVIQDMIDGFRLGGVEGGAISALGILGVGTQTYEETKPKVRLPGSLLGGALSTGPTPQRSSRMEGILGR